MLKLKQILGATLFFTLPLSPLFAQVFTTDVIVQGSECVGTDCVNGEVFGDHTIRLKENNTRINFDDTSASSSFPSTDWTLGANESTNGGRNMFYIEDATMGRQIAIFEGSAPTNSLYVDNAGRLGFGTAEPLVNLHVVEGNTATLRLEQDGSSGFTEQTFDVAANETNFFIRDVTNGSTLPFKIKPGAPSNAIYVNASGDVSLGSTRDDEKLFVNGNIGANGNLHLGKLNIDYWFLGLDTTSATANSFIIEDAATGNSILKTELSAPENSLYIHESGNVSIGSDTENQKLYVEGSAAVNGDIYMLSDKRMKKDVKELTYGLKEVLQLDPKQYQYKNEDYQALNMAEGTQLGLIAQEVETVIPEVITNDYVVKDNNGKTVSLKGVNYVELVPVLVKALQEQQAQLDSKNNQIHHLQTRVEQMAYQLELINNHLGLNDEGQVQKGPRPVIVDRKPPTDLDGMSTETSPVLPPAKPVVEQVLDDGREPGAKPNFTPNK